MLNYDKDPVEKLIDGPEKCEGCPLSDNALINNYDCGSCFAFLNNDSITLAHALDLLLRKVN